MSLSAEQPYGAAAAEIIGERSKAVFVHKRKRVLDLSDIEGVHEMRVATRRLRAALEVFGPALQRKRGARALREVKTLAAALGERRDRDVQLTLLDGLREDCEGAERRAVELLAAELEAEQRHANDELAAELKRVKRSHLHRRLARLAR
ncbi:MAG TPA: CHAD domain-containing protein [Solirubrobacteraceae bacterium]|jgi:CHAD domain-containing protein